MQKQDESREEFLDRRRNEFDKIYKDAYGIDSDDEFEIGVHSEKQAKKAMDG